MGAIECAFCKGKGKDPFDLLSALATCQVCWGKGTVEIKKPFIKCGFCEGSGVYPHNGRITCTVCYGKGSVSIEGETEVCPKCKGSAREKGSGLPCIKCRGRGVLPRILEVNRD